MRDVHMPKVRRQRHEMSSNVFTSRRTLFQRPSSERVSKIMNPTRPGSRLGDSSMERQAAKGVVRHALAYGPHPRRQEQMIIGSGK